MELRVRYFIDQLNTTGWPAETTITPQATQAYEQAGRMFDLYRGDPIVLHDAVKVCVRGHSRPYAFAAASTAIQLYSFQSDDKYDRDGLREALHFLELAQQMVPDRPEIDINEVALYLCMKRTADARAVLDHIARDNPDFRGLPRTEMWYWDRAGNHAQWLMWSRRAFDLARDEHERFVLLNTAGGYYLMKKMYSEALAAFQKVVAIDAGDPWAWHNMALIYFRTQSYKAAHQCNVNALHLMDFGAARELEMQLQRKRGLLGGWKRA